ncbi:hypothetical protein ITI46_05170 [Streptomyces oryzae]|uniref:Tetratricopeptide repeat protein n=1 Tax=Streptomyces oryzae TaxID=1434886 RepID=A0ABS3X6T0_9ACTN|nr:hypothetical protein [Streptomyces oryzae]MBO8191087.1 hypothetical protein [Streptomyces oryzae]
MEFDRVVQVRVRTPLRPDTMSFATGYLVAPRLVLTTGHVFGADAGPGGGPVTVRRPEAGGERVPATPLWHRRDATIDASLIEIAATSPWRPPESMRDLRTRPPQRWGQLIGVRPHPVTICGYPRMQKDAGCRLDEQLSGDIHPGSGRLAHRYEVLSGQPLPAFTPPRGAGVSGWSGFSGAALLCGDLLVGVVAQDRRAQVGSRLTATRTRDLLGDPVFCELVARHTGWAPVLEPVEPDHFLAPAACARDLCSPAMVLRADAEAVRFHGREKELRALLDWCRTDPDAFAVRVLTGPGGQGKTRLARQLITNLRQEGWVAAQLRVDLPDCPDGPGPDWSVLDTSSPFFLVVDYAETLPHLIRRLIEHQRTTRHRVRLLLISRAEGEWKTQPLGAGPDTRAILRTAPTLALKPLLPSRAGPTAHAVAFTAAARDLAKLLGHVAGLPQTDWRALAETVRPPKVPSHGHARSHSVLETQMAALVALLESGPAPVGRSPDQPVEELLLDHETRYWEGIAASPMFRLDDLRATTLRRAVAGAVLFGATTRTEALTLTRNVPGLPPTRATDVAEWLRTLYPPPPGHYWGSLHPDRVAEHHAVSHLADPDDGTLTALWPDATDDQRLRAVLVLSRAIGTLGDGSRPASDEAGHVLGALEAALKSAPPSLRFLRAATAAFPYPPPKPLAPLDLLLHYRLAAAYRKPVATDPAGNATAYALTLNELAVRLRDLGRREDALTVIERAVVLERRLIRAHDNAEAERGLGTALYNWGQLLCEAGCYEEALTVAEEAVAVEQQCVRTDRSADESYLAQAHFRLSVVLRRLERYSEAEVASRAAVDGYLRLAQANRAYASSLARVLIDLGIMLEDDLGKDREGWAAFARGLEIQNRFGRLGTRDPLAGLR